MSWHQYVVATHLEFHAELRESHGGFAAWIAAHHPRGKEAWVKLFREAFRFTGGEVVGEFLMSIGYLPGSHRDDCPVFGRIARLDPPWARVSADRPEKK